MSDGPIVSSRLRHHCPFRVVATMPGRFAVIERLSDNVIEAGFVSYEAAWSHIVNVLLDGRDV